LRFLLDSSVQTFYKIVFSTHHIDRVISLQMKLTLTDLKDLGFTDCTASFSRNDFLVKPLNQLLTLRIALHALSHSKRCLDNPHAYTHFEVHFLLGTSKVLPKLPQNISVQDIPFGGILVDAQTLVYILALSANTDYAFC
jgi:hypothetical protein